MSVCAVWPGTSTRTVHWGWGKAGSPPHPLLLVLFAVGGGSLNRECGGSPGTEREDDVTDLPLYHLPGCSKSMCRCNSVPGKKQLPAQCPSQVRDGCGLLPPHRTRVSLLDMCPRELKTGFKQAMSRSPSALGCALRPLWRLHSWHQPMCTGLVLYIRHAIRLIVRLRRGHSRN